MGGSCADLVKRVDSDSTGSPVGRSCFASKIGLIMIQNDELLLAARECLQSEIEAMTALKCRIDPAFLRAVRLILDCPGKVLVCGVGKSGLIGRKISATLSSTGTISGFLHPAEAMHGDLGMVAPRDVVILITKSGATAELLRIVPSLRELNCSLIGILGNMNSQLARLVDVSLDASVAREADPCNVAPTSSALVALALGDALTSALMVARKFTLKDYARYHPGGQLGRSLLMTVRDVMHVGDRVAWVAEEDTVKEVVLAMSRYPLSAACVVDKSRGLLGLITDGDLRRVLRDHDDIRQVRVKDVMTRNPITVAPDARLRDALKLMEERVSQISVLPVMESGCCLGLVRIHDIYTPGNGL